ncbi:MAG: hypothetical protein GX128_00050 [Bacteroidales bacterium]|jgi:hypothetical protein|nr:hypothetical protein [Bacteroidales bacterium]
MSLAKFQYYIEHPASLDSRSLTMIRSVIEEYPFCQTAHMLYACNLKNIQHISYNSQLSIVAAYAGDRSKLRSLLFLEYTRETSELYLPVSENVISNYDTEEKISEISVQADDTEIQDDILIAEPDKKRAEILSKEEIINRFIQQEPHITRPQKEFFNPVNYAKQSTIDDEAIVSETLARIFLQQGHKEKAIRVFKRLILIYPEKSSTFAAQIEKIEKDYK